MSTKFSNLSIRDAQLSELDLIVKLHISSMPTDFLSNLGVGTLRRYYLSFMSTKFSQSAQLIGAYDAGLLVGFCHITFCPISFRKAVSLDTCFFLVFLLFSKPKVFLNGFIQLFHLIKLDDFTAEISFIAVAPSYQGHGIGQKLIAASMFACRANNFDAISTKTANKRLSSFYQRHFQAKIIKSFAILGRNYDVLRWFV